jgi:porphobilinogen synthase
LLKTWNSEAPVRAEHLQYPIFVTDDEGQKAEIKSLPGQHRWSVDRLPELLEPLVALGLRSIILFGVFTSDAAKTADGAAGYADNSPVVRALKLIREQFPALFVAVDVCLCAYTTHGHCGVLHDDCSINNEASIKQLAAMSVAFARAGAQMISPSDMMDGRVGAIKVALAAAGLGGKVPVMSYSAKFASCFYGPFRDAAGSGAKFGNRGNYQLPPYSRGLALRAIERDLDEGADFLMVKPGMPYLDVVRDCAERCRDRGVPVAIYHVSGEYAMLYHGAAAGAFGLEEAVMEALGSMRRAGATVILTYFTPLVLEVLAKQK